MSHLEYIALSLSQTLVNAAEIMTAAARIECETVEDVDRYEGIANFYIDLAEKIIKKVSEGES